MENGCEFVFHYHIHSHITPLSHYHIISLSLRAMTQEQIKDMRDRVLVLRRFL